MKTICGKLKTSHEGLMIGNGILGSLIFGDDKLNVSLDRIDLWDERNPDEYSRLDFDYDHLENYLNNDWEKAFNVFDKCYGHSYPTKINAGLLQFDFVISDNDKSSIDYINGQVNYYGQNNFLNAYVDYYKNVIVLNFNKATNFNIKMSKYFTKELNDKGLGYPTHVVKKIDSFIVISQPLYDKRYFSIIIYSFANSYFITIIKGKNVTRAKKLLEDYALNNHKYVKKHIKHFNDYFAHSGIVTSNKTINEQYDLGRYYFACNSKKYPTTLHGVWTQNNDLLPPWKADYHNDINVEMSYEHYLKLGNFKEGKVLLDYLVKLLPTFASNAKWFMKSDGYFIPGVMSFKGLPLGGWPQYALNPCCQIWLIKAFAEYYEYTLDKEYLLNTIYPLFLGVEKSVFSKLHLKDGYYEFGFHASPEFFEDDPKSCFKYQTNFEITMLKYLYGKLIEFSDILKRDNTHYKNVYNHLRNYFYDSNGHLMLSRDVSYHKSHRHFSHMLMYKNMKMVDPFLFKEMIKKDIAFLNSYGSENWVGFSFVENAGLYAYVFDGENAYKNLDIFCKAFVHKNGFHMNNDFKNLGYSKMDCYVMTLEANFGFINSLNDMCLNNFNNKVCLFPAIPEIFKNGGIAVKNLLLHGNHKVNGTYKNHKMSFKISLHHKDKILLLNNFDEHPTLVIDGKKVTYQKGLGELIEIEAKKEISYL